MSRAGASWLKGRFGKEAERVRLAYRQVFAQESAAARLVLGDLATLCHVTTTSFVPGDGQATAFAEGKRAVFLHLADLLGVSAEEILRLTAEPTFERE